MTAIESRLTPPRPVELVPADEAGALIDGAHRELSHLEQRAASARMTADETRARAEREGADERASAWAIVRLQRFLDHLRDEAEQDARVVVTAAQRSADTQLDPIIDEGPIAPLAQVQRAAPVMAPAPVASAPVYPVSEPVPSPPAPAPVPTVAWTAPLTSAPSTNGGGHVAPVIAAPVVDEPVVPVAPVVAPVTALATPVASVPAAPAPVVAPVAPAPQSAPAEPKRRRFLHGFPLSAALEVLAVLLVLAFILLRLS